MRAEHMLLTPTIAAILAPFACYMGKVAKALKLPQITGYLVAGIICGPYMLGVLSTGAVKELSYIEGACLSIIGLAAGSELDWTALSKAKKQVLGLTVAVCASSWILCYAAFKALAVFAPSASIDTSTHVVAVSTLGATLMMTRSPASAIAVLKEVDGKGPFCSLVMAVVVVKDVLVIVAFALNMELIRLASSSALVDGETTAFTLLSPLISVAVAVALGTAGSIPLNVLHKPRGGAHAEHTQSVASNRARMVMTVILATLVFQVADYLDAEPLLACVTMGIVSVNRKAEKEKEDTLLMLANIMGITNIAFFSLAGASLKLSSLTEVMGSALLVCLIRAAAIYIGSWLGCKATGTSAEIQRLFWLSMVTQAGVAMGLARLAGTRFPDWGPHFQTFMMAIILVNLLVGPPLFRFALIRAGESRPHAGIAVGFPDDTKSVRSPRTTAQDSGGGDARAVAV